MVEECRANFSIMYPCYVSGVPFALHIYTDLSSKNPDLGDCKVDTVAITKLLADH